MVGQDKKKRETKSLWGAAISAALIFAAVAIGLFFLFVEVCGKDLVAGATNVATIGGIVSGLSLTGTTILGFSGDFVPKCWTHMAMSCGGLSLAASWPWLFCRSQYLSLQCGLIPLGFVYF